MSLTVAAKTVPAPPGDKNVTSFTLALDSSYPNPAGYVITPTTFPGVNRIKRILNIEPTSLAAAATWSYWLVHTYDSDGFIVSAALHLAVVSTGVEVANAANVSTATYTVMLEHN